MSAVLTYKIGELTQRVPCKTVMTLGRDKNSDIVLTDLRVSRNHAMVRRIGHGDYYLVDGGSANGSFINKQRVTMPTLLKNGDCISIGNSDFRFQQEMETHLGADTLSMQETIVHDSPVIKQITILVADIRGFTSLSEQLPIKTLTRLMNSWFTDVSDIILKNEGMVDKFIGDCVFARWETETDKAMTVRLALRSACMINAITRDLNQTFQELPEQIRIGVGINTGAASVGIGQDNSALGDAVNIAFRLESATKMLGKDIVMSESAYRHLPEVFWKDNEQQIKVKGRRDPVRICGCDFSSADKLVSKLF
ncbi:MAG: adenylate/guanylate cyclase domain-containing protein [Gammaproteobacteria bacterium]